MNEYSDTALVLLGHGSSKHASSSIPCRLHADTIRRMNLFSEVHCGFLKEIPFIEQCLAHVRAKKIIILPNFLAEGYYTKKVLPEKLSQNRSTAEIRYLKPIGIDDDIQEIIINLARKALGDWSEKDTTLALLGHGSTKSPRSKDTLLHHISGLEQKTDFAQITDLWLEEPPFIKDWRDEVTSKQVLFIPYLIADGQHGGWDIPDLIGIKRDVYNEYESQQSGEYSIKLTSALGKSPLMVDLIVKRATSDLEES